MTPVSTPTLALPADFTARPPVDNDVAAVVALLAQCSLEELGYVESDEADLRRDWEAPGVSLAEDVHLLHAADGRLVGYAHLWVNDPQPTQPYLWAVIHPDFRGRGLGSALLAWAEQRTREVMPRVPDELRVVLRASTLSHFTPAIELLTGWGMSQMRRFWQMERPLAEPIPVAPWPDDVTLRPFEVVRDAWLVYLAKNEAFRDHWGFVERTDEAAFEQWKHRTLDEPDFDPSLWFIAWAGEEIAGMALCRAKGWGTPGYGWVNVLCVRRPWRKQGLGLALLYHAFAELRARGLPGVGLGVDSANLTGATRLYERAGMQVARAFNDYQKELRPGVDLATRSL